MTQPQPNEICTNGTMKMLKPALERVATDPEFRNRLEVNRHSTALAEVDVELDADTRRELEGRRFSEFWAVRQQAAEGPGRGARPSARGRASSATRSWRRSREECCSTPAPRRRISPRGRFDRHAIHPRNPNFAPPYVPVGPSKRYSGGAGPREC